MDSSGAVHSQKSLQEVIFLNTHIWSGPTLREK